MGEGEKVKLEIEGHGCWKKRKLGWQLELLGDEAPDQTLTIDAAPISSAASEVERKLSLPAPHELRLIPVAFLVCLRNVRSIQQPRHKKISRQTGTYSKTSNR